MPQFTKSQNTAADTVGKDVLVAAGAGSGKTTVLAERIIRRIKAGADISEFLVVTFTTDSAADLREKIGKRLEELCTEFPSERRYRKQLFTLYSASIGTISSMCLKQVRQSAASLGISAQSRVGDEALCGALLTESAETALDDFCESSPQKAALLLDNFASWKDDVRLIKALCDVYSGLRSFPFYKSWLEKQVGQCQEEAEKVAKGRFFESRDGIQLRDIINDIFVNAMENVNTMESFAETEKQMEVASTVAIGVQSIRKGLAQGYREFCEAVAMRPSVRCPKGSGDEYKAANAAVSAECFKALPFYCRSDEELTKEYKRIAEVTSALAELVLLLDEKFTATKREKDLLDFADAEQLFLQLLVTETDSGLVKSSLCKALSARYSDIFIDEYQDVSPLQDMIFALIGEGKRFMVGDAKQSIYGFRDAYPDIFIGYRDSFEDADKNGKTARVFLNENFRCDRNVIDFCNGIFSKIYTTEIAGSDYTKEALIMGKAESGDEKMSVAVFENRLASCNDEYEYITNEILKLCKNGVPPEDIAVLALHSKTLAAASAVLERHGIPVTAKNKTPLFDEPEVMLAMALLRTVDNPTDDISLAAVMRSPLFGFTAEELMHIRKGGTSLYADLCSAADGRYPRGKRYCLKKAKLAVEKIIKTPRALRRSEGGLASKCTAFLTRLRSYREKAILLTAHELLMYLFEETEIFAHATEGAEDAYMSNLYALYDLTKSVESESYKGLSVITEYISKLSETGKSPSAANKQGDGAVSLLTMHGSKGLEFPYVFLCGCGKQLRTPGEKPPAKADYKGGISFDIASQKQATVTETLHRAALDHVEKQRTLAEHLRLLYVAFTRAKKKLYITVSSRRTLADFENYSVRKYVCQADLFMHTLLCGGDSFELVSFPKEEEILAEGMYTPTQSTDTLVDIPTLKDMEKVATVTAKYFVSATHRGKNGLLELSEGELIADRTPVFSTGDGKKSGAQVGTANHAFMQFADYAAAEKDVRAEAKRLLVKGFISKEEYELLRYPMLEGFFGSEIYAELKASPRVYREKRFSTRLDASLFTAEEGESVLVQGVIDCFFENPDGSFTLLDYKTDSAREGDEKTLAEKHGTQLYLYSLYIKKLTGMPVSKAYIYSFALGKAIECEEGTTK